MKFEIKRPCSHCPFRADVHPYLRRAPEIAAQMRDDRNWFMCHSTTTEGTGKRVKRADTSHCMGLARVLWREGNPNVAMRLALAFKLITIRQLEETKPPVFGSLAAFVKHHGGA